MLLKNKTSQLIIIDIQEKLLPVMNEPEALIKNTQALIGAAQHLKIPITVSEQYPKGLGTTVPELKQRLEKTAVFSKLSFSCARQPEIASAIQLQDRPQLILLGIEAHVCVLQTALDWHKQGFQVYVVQDAISSRTVQNKTLACERLNLSQIQMVSTEMVIFEWLENAGTPEFKELVKLLP